MFDEEDLEMIMVLAHELTGSNVTTEQHSVIVQNVANRLTHVGSRDLSNYLAYIENNPTERNHLISALTIHTTSWFREPAAFEVFENQLKEFHLKHPFREFHLLSLACSTGEEVYSFALTLEHFSKTHPDFRYSIDAWDIDPISILTGREATYETQSLSNLTPTQRFFFQGLDLSGKTFSLPASIVSKVHFKIVDALNQPPQAGPYDFIACRNMLIYFETPKIELIVSKLLLHLQPDGLLCIGVSETISVAQQPVTALGHGCFIKAKPSEVSSQKVSQPKSPLTSQPPPYLSHLAGQRPQLRKGILVVDDETMITEMMVYSLEEFGFEVYAAYSADEAMKILFKHDIGLIFSDYKMPPGRSGLDLCKEVYKLGYQGAFVLISGHADVEMATQALAAGANDVILKPCQDFELLKLGHQYLPFPKSPTHFTPEVILIGASTGGIEVLVKMLEKLPPTCPPLVIVQHINADYATDFAERIVQASGLKLGNMEQGEILARGHIYISLGDYHIGLSLSGKHLSLILSKAPPVHTLRPSVDFLFKSTSPLENYKLKALAILLTGMGQDGAKGLLDLRKKGIETIAQDEKSCTVFGMPKEAIKLNAAEHILNPMDIRQLLNQRISLKYP